MKGRSFSAWTTGMSWSWEQAPLHAYWLESCLTGWVPQATHMQLPQDWMSEVLESQEVGESTCCRRQHPNHFMIDSERQSEDSSSLLRWCIASSRGRGCCQIGQGTIKGDCSIRARPTLWPLLSLFCSCFYSNLNLLGLRKWLKGVAPRLGRG